MKLMGRGLEQRQKKSERGRPDRGLSGVFGLQLIRPRPSGHKTWSQEQSSANMHLLGMGWIHRPHETLTLSLTFNLA